MAPLFILLGTFGILYLVNKILLGERFSVSLLGRIAMSAMLVATGISHFTSPEPMIAMMPEFLPWKLELVYFTGVCELAAAVGLLWEKTARLTAVMLIVFFVAILPANILGSLRSVEFSGMQYGPWYLLFRIPLQLFFIWWVWYFGIRRLVTLPNPRCTHSYRRAWLHSGLRQIRAFCHLARTWEIRQTLR